MLFPSLKNLQHLRFDFYILLTLKALNFMCHPSGGDTTYTILRKILVGFKKMILLEHKRSEVNIHELFYVYIELKTFIIIIFLNPTNIFHNLKTQNYGISLIEITY